MFMDDDYDTGYRGYPYPFIQAFYKRASWNLKFAFIPRKCFYSGKRIWFKFAYKGIAFWRDGDYFSPEVRWHDKDEHLIWLLKR